MYSSFVSKYCRTLYCGSESRARVHLIRFVGWGYVDVRENVDGNSTVADCPSWWCRILCRVLCVNWEELGLEDRRCADLLAAPSSNLERYFNLLPIPAPQLEPLLTSHFIRRLLQPFSHSFFQLILAILRVIPLKFTSFKRAQTLSLSASPQLRTRQSMLLRLWRALILV